jgi:hypothetical protein
LVEEVTGSDNNSDVNDDSSGNLNVNELNDEPSSQLVTRSFQSIKEIDTIYEEAHEIA